MTGSRLRGDAVDSRELAVVVLAAGKGRRMNSDLPKVLHLVCGRPLVSHVLDEVDALGAGRVVLVVGHESEAVRAEIGDRAGYAEQVEQKGTGHAAMVALAELGPGFEEVLVLPGDSPLVTAGTLLSLVEARRAQGATAALLCAELDDPVGYGRVVRGEGGFVERIVEEADAAGVETAIKEVNACVYAFDRALLAPALESLTTDNAQGEYYLTDVVERLVSGGHRVVAVRAPSDEVLGVNDRGQLAGAEAIMRARINEAHMLSGVTMVDPTNTYIDHGVRVGRDTVIMPLVFITGASRVGAGCRIGPCTSINGSSVGDRSEVEFSWLDGCEVAEDVRVGPFSRLRPGCRVEPSARIGSFVEIKNTVVGRGSKVPHLSYMGDARIGEGVNVGAGSITCNYDGERKHRTVIGDGAFLGSDTMLIAPVRIGDGATTGAGSSIYEDVPDGSLGIERSEQKNVPGWKDRKASGRGKRARDE